MTRALSPIVVLFLTLPSLLAGGPGAYAALEATPPPQTREPSTEPTGKPAPPPEVQKEIEQNRAADAKLSVLRRAASEHPEEVRYQIDLLQGLLDLSRVDEGLDLAPTVLEKFPRSADLAVIFGRFLLRDGQFDLAGVQFQRALSLGGDNARARSLAARTEIIKGNISAAEGDLRKAVTLDPDLQEARQMLGFVYERMGRYAEALDQMKGAARGGRQTLLQGFVKEPPMSLPATFSPVVVPFIAARGYPPAIRLQIGDGIERLFVIDTASEDVSLTEDAARLIGVGDTRGGKEAAKDAEGAEASRTASAVSYAVLPRVKIADLVIQRVPVRITPGLRYPDDQIAGSLGRSFLRSFRLVLDYPARTATLSNASGPPLVGVPFDLASVILLEGFNGNKAVGKFVLDTASYTPGALDARFVAEQTGLTIFSEDVKKIPSGPYLFTFTMPSLKVGGAEFSKFPATAVDLRMMSRQIGVNVRGVIGNSLLKQCRLEIDFKNQRLSLEKAAPPAPAPAEPGA